MASITTLTQMLVVSAYLFYLCGAMRGPLGSRSSNATKTAVTATAFECGKANGPCGTAIPAGVTCKKGLGWCEPGYYCGGGWQLNPRAPSKCLPLPKDCGKVGKPCCPSNTDTPHTSLRDKLTRAPFCEEGNYCFYVEVNKTDIGDMYAGNIGSNLGGINPCEVLPKDCGTGPGSPCCPWTRGPLDSSWPTPAFQPPLKHMFTSCAGKNAFCALDRKPEVCALNHPDCGKFGKPCYNLPETEWVRMLTGGVASTTKCGPDHDEPGSRGVCLNPPGNNGTQRASARASQSDLVCTQCPEKVTDRLKATDTELYDACRY